MNHRQKLKREKKRNKELAWKCEVMRAIVNNNPHMETLYREIVFPAEHTKVIGKVEELTATRMIRLDTRCKDNARILECYKEDIIYKLMKQVSEFVEMQEVKIGEEYPCHEWYRLTASINVCRKINRNVIEVIRRGDNQ